MEPNWTRKERNSLLINNKYRSDIKFVVGEDKVEIFGHQILIEAGSPVFYTMFSSTEFLDVRLGVIEVPDITPAIFLEMMKFLYIGEMNITNENLVDIYYCSKKYMIECIKEKCLQHINLGNVLEIMETNSKSYNFEEVQEQCINVLKKNPIKVFNDKKIQNLNAKNIEIILNQHYDTCSSYDLLNILKLWRQKEDNKPSSSMERIHRGLVDEKVPEIVMVFGENIHLVVLRGRDLISDLIATTNVHLIGVCLFWHPRMKLIKVYVDDELNVTKSLAGFRHINDAIVEQYFETVAVLDRQRIRIHIRTSTLPRELSITCLYIKNAKAAKYFTIEKEFSWLAGLICKKL